MHSMQRNVVPCPYRIKNQKNTKPFSVSRGFDLARRDTQPVPPQIAPPSPAGRRSSLSRRNCRLPDVAQPRTGNGSCSRRPPGFGPGRSPAASLGAACTGWAPDRGQRSQLENFTYHDLLEENDSILNNQSLTFLSWGARGATKCYNTFFNILVYSCHEVMFISVLFPCVWAFDIKIHKSRRHYKIREDFENSSGIETRAVQSGTHCNRKIWTIRMDLKSWVCGKSK